MKHIQTTSKAEKANRELYKVARLKTPRVAEESQIADLRQIIELTRQKDEIDLKISELKGKIMGVMQDSETLANANGDELVTWKNGSDKKSVDYDGIITELNIPPAVIAKHTSYSKGSRVFTIVDENL
jgi:hypothetical protein